MTAMSIFGQNISDSAAVATVVVTVTVVLIITIKVLASLTTKHPLPERSARTPNAGSGGSVYLEEKGVKVRRSARVRAMTPTSTPESAALMSDEVVPLQRSKTE